MKHIAQIVLIVLGVVMTSATWAQDDLYQVTGFRSAQFGMSDNEVFNAIQQDFGFGEDQIEFLHNEQQGTYLLHIVVPSLDPGPGTGHVYYILGANSLRLMHINVLWMTSDSPSIEQRNEIGVAGMQLARYFQELSWAPENARAGIMRGSDEIVTFAGVDPSGAGVEVLVKGVPVSGPDGLTPTVQGQAMLRVSYTQRYGRPDVVNP